MRFQAGCILLMVVCVSAQCDTSRWPKVLLPSCGSCKVRTGAVSIYDTCNNYCKAVGLSCKAAFEDKANDCQTIGSYTCSSSFKALATSDMICECQSSGGSGGGGGGGSGGGGTGVSTGNVQHIGSTAQYRPHTSGNVVVSLTVHANAKPGDLLLLSLMRTDDVLPIKVDGWKYASSCFKTDNASPSCGTLQSCTDFYDQYYCRTFGSKGIGRDLATAMFYRTLDSTRSFKFTLRGGHAGWGILSVFRGANNANPIGQTAGTSYDKVSASKYPSVSGNAGDMLVLSMSFDDTVAKDKFTAPSGMSTFAYTSGEDEAGFVYGAVLTKSGATGEKITGGGGASAAKDCLISMIIRAGAQAAEVAPAVEPAPDMTGCVDSESQLMGKVKVAPKLLSEIKSLAVNGGYPYYAVSGGEDVKEAFVVKDVAGYSANGCVPLGTYGDDKNQEGSLTWAVYATNQGAAAAAKACSETQKCESALEFCPKGGEKPGFCAPQNDYCTAEFPCKEGEGDCDANSHCEGDLKCGSNNCGAGFAEGIDCCFANKDFATCKENCKGTGKMCTRGGQYPNSCVSYLGGYCSKEMPCEEGEGDCDHHNQCKVGLVCGTDNCNIPGWPTGADCCMKSTGSPPPEPPEDEVQDLDPPDTPSYGADDKLTDDDDVKDPNDTVFVGSATFAFSSLFSLALPVLLLGLL